MVPNTENDHQENALRFAVLQNLYYSGRRDEFDNGLKQWRTEAPKSPFIRYLQAIVARHQLAPKSMWARDYESGLECGLRHPAPPEHLKRWDGSHAGSRSITVWAEEGLGDFVRHARHIPSIKEYCDEVVVHVPQKILPLIQNSFPECHITSSHEEAVKSDFHVASGSLDGFFWAAKSNPQSAGYLSAQAPEGAAAADPKTLKVGVCSRSTKLAWDRDSNYTNLAALSPIFQSERFECHSLQYTYDDKEIMAANRAFSRPVISYPQFDFFNDITTLSNIIVSLDMVIATSTLVADLAAALGVKTWRFHAIPGQKLISGANNSDILDISDPNPGRSWYGNCTTIAYRGEQDTWDDFFAAVASHL